MTLAAELRRLVYTPYLPTLFYLDDMYATLLRYGFGTEGSHNLATIDIYTPFLSLLVSAHRPVLYCTAHSSHGSYHETEILSCRPGTTTPAQRRAQRSRGWPYGNHRRTG